ncbi:hypothetical protein BGZ76_004268 [Entomortierella beljakovae]|nr:hypothetical protein BGZ76_004268 [Entomortierella beljakovae]
MTEEAQQKIRSLVEMAMSYRVDLKPLSVPAVPETLDALVEQLNSKLNINDQQQNQQDQQEEAWDGESFGVKLANLGQLLSNDATKATLACKPPAEPKSVIAMVNAFGETCFRLAGFIDSIPVKVAGQTYKREIQSLANDIFFAVAGLMNEFLDIKDEKVIQLQQQKLAVKPISDNNNNNPPRSSKPAAAAGTDEKDDAYLMKAGIVWEACSNFEKASRSNRQAVAKKWGDIILTLEDASSEVQEMIDSNDSKKDDEDDDSEDGSGSDSDDSWNDDEKMTEEEKQMSVRTNSLLKLTRLLFKKLQQRCLDATPTLTVVPSNSETQETSTTPSSDTITLKPSDLARMWDQLYDRAQGIVDLGDEVASSLYSPQDHMAIVGLLKELNRKNHDCILVGRLFIRGQAEHEKWLDMCEAQFKKIFDTIEQGSH